MLPNSGSPAEALLHQLLDRFEAPKARVRDITQPIDYTRIIGAAAQDEFHRVLSDAERAGSVALETERLGRFTGELARIRLVNPGCLYRFLVRSPASTRATAAHHTIEAAVPEILADPFFAEVEQEAIAAWASNKGYLGIGPTQTDALITLLRLTHGIINLAGRDIDHRTFSRRIVKDSKALERAEGRVAQLLKRRNPSLAGEQPRDVLDANGIIRRAHLLQVKGPLQISSGALQIEGTGEVFIGLPWAAVQQAVLTMPVDYIVTIENPTSFWRYCTEIGGHYLALLSDGFPARDILSSMRHLVKEARRGSNAPVYHWGDIDAGGVRIAAHLEDMLGVPVFLHEMSAALAIAKGSSLQSRKGLDQLALRDGDIGELARWLISDQAMALEQEELDPIAPIPPHSRS